MNFNNHYNKILEQLSGKPSIPTDIHTPQVWLYSNNGGFGDTDKEWINLLDEENADWVLHHWKESFDFDYNFEYVCDNIEDLSDAIAQELKRHDEEIAKHYRPELKAVVLQFKQRVINNPIGYYKLFGNYENDDIFIAYIYLPPTNLDAAKDATKEDTDDINNW
jgi:hypothetical protein